jgi:hypothetical protein
MKSKKAVWGLVVLVVVAVSVVSACGGAGSEPAQPAEEATGIDAEVLLEERCTECHGLDRTTNASKSAEEWEQTVTRMVAQGARLNDEEQAVLIDYLAENYGP